MKTKLYTSLALFYLTSLMNAYSQTINPFRVGITLGVNAANAKTDNNYHSLLLRYNLGVSLKKRFSPTVELVSHILYSRQGFTNPAGIASNGNILVHQTYTLDYITLPVLLRIHLKKHPFFWEAGGQVGGLLYNNLYFVDGQTISQPIPDASFFDAGLTGGLGYRLGRHWVTDLRYYYGLLSARKRFFAIPNPQTGVVTNYPITKWYNRVFSINLSYYF